MKAIGPRVVNVHHSIKISHIVASIIGTMSTGHIIAILQSPSHVLKTKSLQRFRQAIVRAIRIATALRFNCPHPL